jgi:hypothetical protein
VLGEAIGEGIGLNRGDRMPFPDSVMYPGNGEMLCASGDPILLEGERSRTGLLEPGNKDVGRGDNTGLRGGVVGDVGRG